MAHVSIANLLDVCYTTALNIADINWQYHVIQQPTQTVLAGKPFDGFHASHAVVSLLRSV